MDIPGVQDFQEYFDKIESDPNDNVSPELQRIQRSFTNRRSTRSLSMVFLGLSNAGISHSINRLVNQSIFSVGRTTGEIIECSFYFPATDLKIGNAQVHLIDTPGFGDPYKDWDSSCYPALVRYFEQQCYLPNAIILTANITEKALDASGSGRFWDFLSKIQSELKDLIDLKNPNVLIILTHLSAASLSVQNDPSIITRAVEEIAEEIFRIPVPVVVSENRAEGNCLRRVGEFYVLPSGTLFPRNIYWELMKLTEFVDPVGHCLVTEMLDNFAALNAVDIEKSMLSFQDNIVIKSPPPHIYQDLLEIDFSSCHNSDIGSSIPKLEFVNCLDERDLEGQLDVDNDENDSLSEDYDFLDALEVNEFAETVQILQIGSDASFSEFSMEQLQLQGLEGEEKISASMLERVEEMLDKEKSADQGKVEGYVEIQEKVWELGEILLLNQGNGTNCSGNSWKPDQHRREEIQNELMHIEEEQEKIEEQHDKIAEELEKHGEEREQILKDLGQILEELDKIIVEDHKKVAEENEKVEEERDKMAEERNIIVEKSGNDRKFEEIQENTEKFDEALEKISSNCQNNNQTEKLTKSHILQDNLGNMSEFHQKTGSSNVKGQEHSEENYEEIQNRDFRIADNSKKSGGKDENVQSADKSFRNMESFQEICPTVKKSCTVIQESYPAIQDYCPAIQQSCPTIQDSCPAIQQSCSAIQDSCPAIQDSCPAIQDSCPGIEKSDPEIHKSCPTIQETCPSIHEGSSLIQEANPIIPQAIPAIPETTGMAGKIAKKTVEVVQKYIRNPEEKFSNIEDHHGIPKDSSLTFSSDAINNNIGIDFPLKGALLQQDTSELFALQTPDPEIEVISPPEPAEDPQAQFIMFTVMGIGIAGLALFAPKLYALWKLL